MVYLYHCFIGRVLIYELLIYKMELLQRYKTGAYKTGAMTPFCRFVQENAVLCRKGYFRQENML